MIKQIPPIPSTGQPYTYISPLRETHPDIWQQAVALVNKFSSNMIFGAEDRRMNAIEFLHTMAAQWRGNEEAFLRNEIIKLVKIYRSVKIYTEGTKVINNRDFDLKSSINILMDYLNSLNTDSGFDYQKFSSAINYAIEGTKRYEARLSRIKNQFEHPHAERGLLQGINEEYTELIQLLTHEKELIEDRKKSYEKLTAEYVYKYVQAHSKELQAACLDDKQFSAWLLQLSVQFREYLEQSHAEERKRTQKAISDQKKDMIKNFEQFTKLYNDELLSFNNAKKEGLSTLASSLEFQKYNASNKRAALRLPSLSDIPSETYNVVFTSNLNPSQLDEHMRLLVVNNLQAFLQMGGAGMGDDALAATFTINYNEPHYDQLLEEVNKALKQLQEAMAVFARLRDNRELVAKENAKMNVQIENILKELDQTLGTFEEEQKVFIIHESDKYYQIMEQGYAKRWNGDAGFHGRTMSILNYIDIMNNLSISFNLGDIPLMKFVAYNLGSSSPGADKISLLEEIFTYAAGMIMFDDLGIAVKEATRTLQFSNITNIHLYKLQEMYFPGSYLLEETAKYLEGCPYDQTNAAIATIEAGDNIYTPGYESTLDLSKESNREILKKINKHATKEAAAQWQSMRDYAASHTKVSIHFFLNFVNFIKGMQ